jgi:uroporphyrinogen-III decarboxylase
VLKSRGTIPFIDTDGKIDRIIPWFAETGIDGFVPLERQAGVDIVKYRQTYPKLRLSGAYDKMVMVKTESDMRAEFERILPVMRQGGYIPSVDHQTPPGVSLSNYKIYLKLLKEYCSKI